ncbi:MAG: hypothetical protein U1E73_08775 [Planctomycetota bacterium]
MNTSRFGILLPLLASGLFAQTTTIFPDEYVNVPEGPGNSPNMPLAYGTSRVQCVYEAVDMAIPAGHQITQIGWRQDGGITTLDAGRTIQLEIKMAYSDKTAASLTTTFATNLVTTPVTVYGPTSLTLPNLRDAANPLPNGQFFIPLATPFTYDPALGNLVVEYWIYGNSGGGTAWNWRLDRSDFYSPVTYGPAGCPHSGGPTPSLSLAGFRPGQNFSASLTSGPGNAFAVLVIVPGQQIVAPYSLQTFIPGINPLCEGQVNFNAALTLTGFTGTTGAKSWGFAVPNNAAYNDFFWSAQAVMWDFFAPGGLVVSRGGHVQTGVNPRTSILRAQGPPQTLTTGSVQRNYNPVTFFVHQ